jgi:hypothetical protein
MPRTSQHPKDSSFNFRIDPALKAAFSHATEAEDKPAAQVLRDFMRAYVKQREHRAFLNDAHRQSLEAAARASDPRGDDAVSLQEFETLFDKDHFADEWKA